MMSFSFEESWWEASANTLDLTPPFLCDHEGVLDGNRPAHDTGVACEHCHAST